MPQKRQNVYRAAVLGEIFSEERSLVMAAITKTNVDSFGISFADGACVSISDLFAFHFLN